jgi:hypothetical protein
MEKDKENLEEKTIEESRAESILGIMAAGGSAIFYQMQMYDLMERSGLYEIGLETNDYTVKSLAIFMGCASIICCGFYIGSKIGKYLAKAGLFDESD